jgi:hypothetical protein
MQLLNLFFQLELVSLQFTQEPLRLIRGPGRSCFVRLSLQQLFSTATQFV